MPYKDPEAKRAQARAWAKANRLQWTEEKRAERHAYDVAYYAAHKEELAAKAQIYNATNKAEVNAKSRAYHAAHKEERNARSRAYKLAHKEELAAKRRMRDATRKEELAAKFRVYRLAHKEELAAKFHEYAATHKKELAAKDRAYAAANKTKKAAYRRAYYADNKEELRLKRQAYLAAHPGIGTAATARRRARKKNAPRNDLTHAQWLAIQEAQQHCCAYCGKRCKGHLTQDHITPLSQGGSHTLHNVIGACISCNSKKRTGPPLSPVQPLLLDITSAKKKKAS